MAKMRETEPQGRQEGWNENETVLVNASWRVAERCDLKAEVTLQDETVELSALDQKRPFLTESPPPEVEKRHAKSTVEKDLCQGLEEITVVSQQRLAQEIFLGAGQGSGHQGLVGGLASSTKGQDPNSLNQHTVNTLPTEKVGKWKVDVERRCTIKRESNEKGVLEQKTHSEIAKCTDSGRQHKYNSKSIQYSFTQSKVYRVNKRCTSGHSRALVWVANLNFSIYW